MVMWLRRLGVGSGSLASWLLVATQGVLFVGIVIAPASWGPRLPSAIFVGAVVFCAGSAGIVASAAFLGRALTALPEPNGAGMTARGIYRWMRHPMYTSVTVAFLGVALARGSFVALALVGVLGVFFEFKTRREERFLKSAYPGYASYAARTSKFIPGIGGRVSPPNDPV